MASNREHWAAEPARRGGGALAVLRPARSSTRTLWRKADDHACCEEEDEEGGVDREAAEDAGLTVGKHDDPMEHEADRVADDVLSGDAPAGPVKVSEDEGQVRRKCSSCAAKDEEEEKTIRREPAGGGGGGGAGAAGGGVPSVVSQTVQGDAGRPLGEGERSFFERRMGHDLGGVRVHTGGRAAEAAGAVDARAFTLGDDIYFGEGEYDPGTHDGRRLVAHELAHVLQQRGSGTLRRTIRLEPKTKWRKDKVITYKTKKEADDKVRYVRSLGLAADEPTKDKGGWGFEYAPLNKAEAEADQAAKEKARGTTSTFTVKFDDLAKSYYVKETKKCPEAIPPKAGYSIWEKCFATKKEATALVRQFETLHVKAEVYELSADQFGVYYKPLTEKEAEAGGKAEIAAKPDAGSGMYTTKVSKDAPHKTFTWEVEVGCPAGYEVLGDYHITGYAYALEELYKDSPRVKVECGGLAGETFHKDFLTKTTGSCPYGVKMEGSGVALDGTIVHYDGMEGGKNCFSKQACALGNKGKCLTDKGVATGPDIKHGTELLIEGFGKRTAEDVGGGIKKKEIDVWFEKDWRKACTTNFTGKVCKKK